MPASGSPLVVTDSSACLPAPLLDDAAVRVLPISVSLIDAEGRENTAVVDDLQARLQAGEAMKSSPPTVLDYFEAIEDSDRDAAVVLTPAVEFTVMRRHAEAAADLANREVHVVDTRTAAAAQGLVVLAALRAAQDGATAEAVADVARRAAARADLVAVLDSLASLRRSGHVPATALDTDGPARRVLFRFRDGSVVPLGGATRVDDALERLVTEWRDGGGDISPSTTMVDRFPETLVFHAGEELRARRLRQRLGRADPVVEFSVAMALHTGPSCVGVAWLHPGDAATT